MPQENRFTLDANELRDRRLKLLDAVLVLGGLVGAAAVIKPIPAYGSLFAYFFAIFILATLGTYIFILFDVGSRSSWHSLAYVTRGIVIAFLSSSFAGILALLTSEGMLGLGVGSLQLIPVGAFYVVAPIVLFLVLFFPPRH